MKYNVGDIVRIKSKKWYDENKKGSDSFRCQSGFNFTSKMSDFCGLTFEIIEEMKSHYRLKGIGYCWTDEMFEDSIEEPLPEGVGIAVPLSPVKVIDWEQRRFDLAKCAMESLLTTTKIQEYENSHFELDVTEMAISDISVNVANEIIKKLKEMEGVK